MNDNNKVTILLAVYNGEKYLSSQIDSLLGQTYGDWDLLVSDDLSTDSSPEILKSYKERYPDKITILENAKHFGNARDHYFHLLEQCSSHYIMFCDQDDLWQPDKIRLTMDRMKAAEAESGENTPILVHTDLMVTDSLLHVKSESFFRWMNLDYKRKELGNLLVQNIVTGCTVMINRPLADLVGEPPHHALMHDGWLALIACCFGRIEFIKAPTVLYRQHEANQVGAKNVRHPLYVLKQLLNWRKLKTCLEATYTQADEFMRRYQGQLAEDQKQLLKTYASIPKLNKFSRIRTIKRFGFLKNGKVRAAIQLFMV